MAMDDWLTTRRLLKNELKHKQERGAEVSGMQAEYEALLKKLEPREDEFEMLYERVNMLIEMHSYGESSDLDEILQSRPDGRRDYALRFSRACLADKIAGGWLGRSAGCLLGKPVEGMVKAEIKTAAQLCAVGYPLEDYFGGVVNPPEEFKRLAMSDYPALRENLHGMARDDDMDYTVLGLTVMERSGLNFTSRDVASLWLSTMPMFNTYTAERIAYRNLAMGLEPPETATHRNPAREWIGAQIRADAFGYVSPGMPERAAELAFRDAAVSHVANGIYGEMWVAAMIAAAYAESDPTAILEAGLSEIPRNCWLADAVRQTAQWWKQARAWEPVAEVIAENWGYDKLQGCHVIVNAAVVALALLAGEGDFEKTITVAVMAGFDTDCNGATAGSVVGVMLGRQALPAKWIDPLGDHLHTAISGQSELRFDSLVERTLSVAKQNLQQPEG